MDSSPFVFCLSKMIHALLPDLTIPNEIHWKVSPALTFPPVLFEGVSRFSHEII